MIDHVTVHVGDFEEAKRFYENALAPLGYTLGMEFADDRVAGFTADGATDFWINGDGAKQNVHVAFTAADRDEVDAFYEAAIAAGASDNGKPGIRKEYGPGYYASYVLDPDGHNIEAVFHDTESEEDML